MHLSFYQSFVKIGLVELSEVLKKCRKNGSIYIYIPCMKTNQRCITLVILDKSKWNCRCTTSHSRKDSCKVSAKLAENCRRSAHNRGCNSSKPDGMPYRGWSLCPRLLVDSSMNWAWSSVMLKVSCRKAQIIQLWDGQLSVTFLECSSQTGQVQCLRISHSDP